MTAMKMIVSLDLLIKCNKNHQMLSHEVNEKSFLWKTKKEEPQTTLRINCLMNPIIKKKKLEKISSVASCEE